MQTAARTVRLALPTNNEGRHGLIAVTDTFGVVEYLVDRVPTTSNDGPVFDLQQLGTYETFRVRFPRVRGAAGTCSCLKGWRHADCSHVLAVKALRAAGKL